MECIVYECKDLRFTSCPCVTLCAVSAYQLTTPYFTCTAKTEQNQHYEPFQQEEIQRFMCIFSIEF